MALTTAIVLNWRRPSDTIACVGSLISIGRDLDIVVVDNDSGDGSLAAISQGLAPIVQATKGRYALLEAEGSEFVPTPGACVVTLVQSGRNGGYAFGNNVGIRLALTKVDCQYVWILNNDTVVRDRSSLDALLDKMVREPAIGLCGSTVAYAGQDGLVQALGGGAFDSRMGRCTQIGNGRCLADPVDEAQIEGSMAYVNGAAAFARRAFVEDVGLMTEDYFLYYEEIDWAKRSAGRWKLGFCAESIVYHEVGASIGTDDFGGRSPLSAYYLTRNRLKFLARHAPRALPMAAVDLLKEVLRHLRRGERVQAGTMARAILGFSYRPSSR